MAVETDAQRLERHHQEHMERLGVIVTGLELVVDKQDDTLAEARKPWYKKLFNG